MELLVQGELILGCFVLSYVVCCLVSYNGVIDACIRKWSTRDSSLKHEELENKFLHFLFENLGLKTSKVLCDG